MPHELVTDTHNMPSPSLEVDIGKHLTISIEDLALVQYLSLRVPDFT